jgi:hypothetical protein
MFSNNQKIASFYPTGRKNHNNNYKFTQQTTSQNFVNFINDNKNVGSNEYISESVELALITVNLSYARFKTMNMDELDNYVKTSSFDNSFNNRKYLLALNILLREKQRVQQTEIIKQEPLKNQKEKNVLNNNFNNFSQSLVYEPDEFKLDFNVFETDNKKIFNINNNHQSVETPKFSIKQNKNLDLSTFNGNPHGIVKITNNNPANSVRPFHKLNETTANSDLTSIAENTEYTQYNEATNYDNYSQYQSQNTNSIIKQGSFIQNPATVFANGGRRRSSNLDVGSSNNFISFQ